MNTVMGFSEFINEELNFTTYDNGVCRLEDRWFFYNPDDDIIYGCDDRPVNDDFLFSFNPTACKIVLGGEEKQYDVTNPICLIRYDMDEEKVTVYTENAVEYLRNLGFAGADITSSQNRNRIMDIFEKNDDKDKYILIYGDQMIASTFDVIEEN